VNLSVILLVVAFCLFIVGALPIASRVNLVSLGLAFWVLSLLIGTQLGK
jgi:hypothetical protein